MTVLGACSMGMYIAKNESLSSLCKKSRMHMFGTKNEEQYILMTIKHNLRHVCSRVLHNVVTMPVRP